LPSHCGKSAATAALIEFIVRSAAIQCAIKISPAVQLAETLQRAHLNSGRSSVIKMLKLIELRLQEKQALDFCVLMGGQKKRVGKSFRFKTEAIDFYLSRYVNIIKRCFSCEYIHCVAD
jgi:hypothetical protein